MTLASHIGHDTLIVMRVAIRRVVDEVRARRVSGPFSGGTKAMRCQDQRRLRRDYPDSYRNGHSARHTRRQGYYRAHRGVLLCRVGALKPHHDDKVVPR